MGSKLFVDNANDVSTPGVYGIEQAPPLIIRGVSNGYIGMIGKFAWGPVHTAFLPESGKDILDTLEPAGSPRDSSGYRAIMKRPPASWLFVGIKGVGHAAALLSTAGTGGNVVVTGKYSGARGNSITREIKAATGGDVTKRDIVIQLTDAITGTTKETYQNVAMNVAPDVSRSKLIAGITFTGTMTAWPANGVANLAAGSDGAALTALDYQTALDALALEDQVRVVVADDPGDSIRDAVNANIAGFCTATKRHVCFLQGDPDNTWAQNKTDKLNYVNERVCYVGNWIKVFDDAGILRQSPLATSIAVVRNRKSVHLSVAQQDTGTSVLFDHVRQIDAAFDTSSDTIQTEATNLGIMLLKKLPSGAKVLVHGRTSDPTSGKKYEVTRWYRDYVALSLITPLGNYVNGPNDPQEDLEIKSKIEGFFDVERAARRVVASKDDQGVLRPAFFVDIESLNSATTRANGDFFVKIEARTPGVRERTFLVFNIGETVSVSIPT